MPSDVLERTLGRYVIAFGEVEEALALSVVRLVDGPDEQVIALVSHLPFLSLVAAAERLIELRDESPDGFDQLAGRLRKAEETRNTFVHASGHFYQLIGLAEIEQATAELRDLSSEVQRFFS